MKKFLSVVLAVVIMICMVPIGMFTLTASAATKTKAEALHWLSQQVGKSINYDNGPEGAQCVDLIYAYYNYLGVAVQGGNGCDYAWNALPSGWQRIAGATPQPGDIMVWTNGVEGLGHVAICGDNGRYYHQNWNGQYVEVLTHSYTGGFSIYNGTYFANYYGVVRPNFTGSVSLVTPTISFNKSSYIIGDTVTISWKASPSNSNISHYWVNVYNPDGSVNLGQNVDKTKNSFVFTPSSVGTYSVKVFATPVGSQSGEGSLTDTKSFTVSTKSASLVTPTITFNKSSYSLGNTVTISWKASPSNSNISHYWINVYNPDGSVYIDQSVKLKTSFSFTPSSVGTYKVKVFATPSGSQSGEGSLTDTKSFTVKNNHSHNYKTTTTKATTSKNGKVVKKCTTCGKVASTTTIKYAKSFKLTTTTYTYNGKTKTPSVVVKDSSGKTLKKNTDYTVTYAKGRKNVGTYKVTIKMKGKYSGTKTLSFKIKPVKTTVSKLTAGKKSITVNISKKSTQVSGYQVQYSTSKKFTSAKVKTISSYKTTKYTLKSLKAKKTYYARVRTYKTVNGKKYYSAWSNFKKIKTK